MRKKYLSALLFGALLFASAGTFTSCKDYDDDINNLQEQINTINTTLTELKSQIGDKGVSSVTFDEATGILTVVDAEGTHAYNIATSATTMVEAEIKDGKLYINDEEIGAVVGEVTVKDGKLMVDGKEVATLGGENGVSLVKNGDNQTYTLTVDGTSVVLPANADATTVPAISFVQGNDGEYKVKWGVAEKEITFNNTKIAAGSLLLGGMNKQTAVTVDPITYDLGAQTLKLVDVDGNYAKVKVEAIADDFDGTTSRAASLNGVWKIKLTATDEITAENVATAFTKTVNGVEKNLMYALEVNGVRATGYEYIIDTDTENESANNEALKDNALDRDGANGTTVWEVEPGTVTYVPDNASVVSAYMKFEGANETQADVLGIKVDGTTVTVPASAVSESVTAKMYVLDVTGAQTSHDVTIKVKASQVSAVETVKQATVSVKDGKFTVEFGDIFANLSSDIAVAATQVELTTADAKFFALESLTATNEYYTVAVKNLAKSFKNAKDEEVTIKANADYRSIVKADFELNKAGYNSASNDSYLTKATKVEEIFGNFNLLLTLKDASNNELKKIVVPVKVAQPEFSEYFSKNTYAAWDGDSFTRVLKTDDAVGKLEDDKLYLTADGENLSGNPITYTYKFGNMDDFDAVSEFENNATAADLKTKGILEAVSSSNANILKIKTSSISVKAEGETGVTISNVTAGSNTITDNEVKVESTFTMKLQSMLSGISVKYYKDNVASTTAVVYNPDKGTGYTSSPAVSSTAAYIMGYQETTEADAKEGTPAIYNGIGFEYNGKMYDLQPTTIQGVKIAPISDCKEIEGTDVSSIDDVAYAILKADGSIIKDLAGTPLVKDKTTSTATAIVFSDAMTEGTKGALTFQLVDELGIQTLVSIDVEQVNENSPIDK